MRPEVTERLTCGVRRALDTLDFATLTEFSPGKGRRVDVVGVGTGGEIIIVEVKSGIEDLRADHKWRDYLEWCDRFFFCVDLAFPLEALDPEVGVFRADGFHAEIVRPAPVSALAPARRRSVTRKFAREAARRLHRLQDPDFARDHSV